MRAPVLAQHLELEPRAADFLDLLRDLGHVDEAAIERITDTLVKAPRRENRVSFDELRRVVALQLFDGRMHPESRDVLDAEWARLFS